MLIGRFNYTPCAEHAKRNKKANDEMENVIEASLRRVYRCVSNIVFVMEVCRNVDPLKV